LFYDKSREFYDTLDSNMNLLGFNNGIYDLELDEFRKGRPEDYITMSTNIDFIPYDAHSVEMNGIHKFIKEILTIKAVRDYVIKLMATFLSGSTKSEKFHVWSGSGGNGKSKLIELLERCLGDYAGKMNISNLTQKRGSAGSANPELARTKGKRFINMQEPDEHCKLNVGLMKEMTGGDKIIARALFKEPIEFKPQFKMVLTCNDKPELPPDDEGTWRRVVLVEYRSKFRHDPNGTWLDLDDNNITWDEHKLNLENRITTDVWNPKDPENPQFPIDESVNESFDVWAEPFMSLLLQTYKENKHIDLREPDEVKEYTKKYREANQHFKDFINDKIIFDDECTDIIKIENLFQEYKIWYKDNNGTAQNQKKQKDLKSFMEKEYGDYWEQGVPYKRRGYIRLRLVPSSNGNGHDINGSEDLDFIEEDDDEESRDEKEEQYKEDKKITFKKTQESIESFINDDNEEDDDEDDELGS
jgi:P4 family phage/plasmid primase-like protien